MNKYNIQTDVFKHGKCTYKVRVSDFGKDEIVEHSDAPLLAPRIFIFNDDIQYDFKNTFSHVCIFFTFNIYFGSF